MEFAPFRNWTCHLLMSFLILLAASQAQMVPTQPEGQVTCDELRQRMTMNFMQTYQNKVPDVFLGQLLPKYVESLLPSACVQNQDPAAPSFNPASTKDNGGPLGALGGTGTIYAMSTTRHKREVEESENVQLELGISRDKRSTTTVTEEDGMSTAMDITNLVADQSPLAREKRFLNRMTFGGASGMHSPLSQSPFSSMSTAGPRREISESAKMFNTLLMFTKLQNNRLRQEYSQARIGNLQTDRISFKDGMYGDPYPGRRKREAVAPMDETMTESNLVEEPYSRQKRFLLPAAEPGEGPPSMMSVMMGTAVDPNSGKRIDPFGDYAKNMMRRAFMASTPFGAMTPPGKEPPEFVKKAAPAWFFSQMQRAFQPQPSFRRSYYDYDRNPSRAVQRQQPGGYYGDRFPGKRRKRSTDAVSDNSIPASVDADSTSDHSRQKRASENANDVITVGDVSIPLEYFKPRERSDDIKYYDSRPQAPPPTYYAPPPQQPQPRQMSYQSSHYTHNPYYQQQQAYNRQNAWYNNPYLYRQLYNRLLAQQAARQEAARRHAAYQQQWAPPLQPTYPVQTPPPYVPPPPPQQKPYVPPQTQKPFVPPPKPWVPPPQPATPPPSSPPQPPPNYHVPQGPPPPPPFLDPFIHPPQGPPPPPTPPRSARKKRSDNKDRGDSSSSNFLWPSPLYAPSFFNRPSYIPPYSSGLTRKVGYRSPKGGLVYGDRRPGPHGGFSRFTTRKAIVSPAIPLGWAGTRPRHSAPGRRFKRSNKEFTDQPGYFSPSLLPNLFSPFNTPRYVPPRYSPFSTKSSYRTGTGRIVYGDRFPASVGRSFPTRTPFGLPPVGGLPPRVGGLPPRVGGLPPRVGGLPQRVGGLPPRVGGPPPRVGGLPPRPPPGPGPRGGAPSFPVG